MIKHSKKIPLEYPCHIRRSHHTEVRHFHRQYSVYVLYFVVKHMHILLILDFL